MSADNQKNADCNTGSCNKLNVYDWLSDLEIPKTNKTFNYLEVRFKNSRKEIYLNSDNLDLHVGEPVAVEAASGHDVGFVSMKGEMVLLQMRKKQIRKDSKDIKKVYRKARVSDINRWKEAQAMERDTMFTARNIAVDLELEMKICDVEYQADKTKAIFYYTADDRVDFRELIKVLADKFKVRIEMRQIGTRQEAGKVGGTGDCGRELCCATWLSDFKSVSTSAARSQQLALNPVKLAGQCGKLKCCLNYELNMYLDALKDFPSSAVKLETVKGKATHQKTDIFKKMMWYSYANDPNNLISLKVERVKEVIDLNQKGIKPDELKEFIEIEEKEAMVFEDVVGLDSITRFDKKRRFRRKRRRNSRNR